MIPSCVLERAPSERCTRTILTHTRGTAGVVNLFAVETQTGSSKLHAASVWRRTPDLGVGGLTPLVSRRSLISANDGCGLGRAVSAECWKAADGTIRLGGIATFAPFSLPFSVGRCAGTISFRDE